MKSRTVDSFTRPRAALLAVICVLAAALAPRVASALAAGADAGSLLALDGSSPVRDTLYDGSTLFTGITFTRFEINVPAPGTLWVTLKDMEFPALAGALSFALMDGGSVLGLINGTGDLSLGIDGPGTLFGYVYGVGAPGIHTASFYLNIVHEYGAPVPLPAAVWMLLGGLGLTGWFGRRRRAPAVALAVAT